MKTRFIAAILLIAYGLILIKVVVFKGLSHGAPAAPPGRMELAERPVATQPRVVIIRWGANFVPFKTILSQLRGQPRVGIAIMNLVGNTVLFVPIGFLAPLTFRKMNWRKSLALAIAVGVAMEGMEWIFNVGIVDVDDVILNALGVMIGYWGFVVLRRRREMRCRDSL